MDGETLVLAGIPALDLITVSIPGLVLEIALALGDSVHFRNHSGVLPLALILFLIHGIAQSGTVHTTATMDGEAVIRETGTITTTIQTMTMATRKGQGPTCQ